MQVVDYGEALALIPVPDDPVEALLGMLEHGPSLTADLMAERSLELSREESSLE